MNDDPISKPLQFRNLTVKNRIFRSGLRLNFIRCCVPAKYF